MKTESKKDIAALALLPRYWEVRKREEMLDGNGEIETWANKAFYVLDGRTDSRGSGDTIAEAIADALGIPESAILPERFSRADIAAIVDDALNLMCEYVQNRVGQTDGGVAGMFWMDEVNKRVIRAYVETEIMYCEK